MPPMTLMIKPVSSLCNMRCAYCFYADEAAHRRVPDYGVMSAKTLETTLCRAFDYAEGALSILFQGGEPTLAGEDFYREAVRLVKRLNTRGLRVDLSIQTNGVNVPDALIELLVKEKFLFGVSLDGTQRTHDAYRRTADGQGTWEKALRTLRRILSMGGQANVLCVVTDAVARNARAVWRALAPFGFLQFIPCMDGLDGRGGAYSLTPQAYGAFLCETYALYERAALRRQAVSVRQFDNYLRLAMGMRPDSCAMDGKCAPYFLVEADGSVFPCDFYALDAYRMGNVQSASFADMGKSEAAEAFLRESLQRADECQSCRWQSMCRGGCRRDRIAAEGGALGRSRWCESYQMLFDRHLQSMRTLFLRLQR